ncbi:MAG: tetratricopeptide repeat protein [Enhydrobacter sp.]
MRKLGVSHCATLLLFGSGALHVDAARAQSQAPTGATLLAPQAAPLSQTLPALKPAEKPTEKPAPQAAAAQPGAGPSDALRAKYDQAFAESLEKPADPDVLVHFAEVAVEFGDIEGAISALERLLLIDAEQPEVKLELGVLYYRLGSIEVARTYLQDVSSSKDSSSENKERANTFLKEMKQP